MGFVRRFSTTRKVFIPEALQKELETQYLHDIVRKTEENNIPPSIVLNLDQTSSKYVPVSNKTLAPKGAKTVPIKGLNDKKIITATFTIAFDDKFLTMLLIHGGKTQQSLSRVIFASSFPLNGNPKPLFDTSPKRGRDWSWITPRCPRRSESVCETNDEKEFYQVVRRSNHSSDEQRSGTGTVRSTTKLSIVGTLHA